MEKKYFNFGLFREQIVASIKRAFRPALPGAALNIGTLVVPILFVTNSDQTKVSYQLGLTRREPPLVARQDTKE